MRRYDDSPTCTNLADALQIRGKWPLVISLNNGAIAQMGERLLCTQEVGGSIPPGSTICGAGDKLL